MVAKLTISTEKWRDWSWHNDSQITVYVTVKDIDAISVSGSGDLIAETPLTGNNFNVNVSGSGSLEAEIQATGDMNAGVSGSGRIELKGKFKNLESSISGSGDLILAATIEGLADFGVSGIG